MGIFSRLSDIINSNINTMLDKAEDPAKIIRLMIQEMEETLVEVRATAARAIAEKKDINRKLNRLEDAQSAWQTKAELAISKDRDDLAKGALAEKSKLADLYGALVEELEELDHALDRHEEDVLRLEAKLKEAKLKQKSLMVRHDTVNAQIKTRKQLHERKIDDSFAKFDHIERRLDEMEGRVESYDLGQGKTLAEEIDELETESKIDAELAALKERVAKGNPQKTPKSSNKSTAVKSKE